MIKKLNELNLTIEEKQIFKKQIVGRFLVRCLAVMNGK